MKLKQVIIQTEITMAVYYAVTVVPRHWSCFANGFLYFDNTSRCIPAVVQYASIYAGCCLPLKFCYINIKYKRYVNKNIT